MATNLNDTTTAIPLADLAQSWIISLRAERKSPATIKAYKRGIDGFLSWHASEFPDVAPVLEPGVVRAYLADLGDAGQSSGTMRLRLNALKLLSAWLTAEGEQPRDLLISMKPPKDDQKIVPSLSKAEVDALVKACKGTSFADRRDTALVLIMADSGLRAGEVIDLATADVSLADGTLTVRRGKGGKGRVVALSDRAAQAVDRYMRARRGHKLAYTSTLWLGETGRPFGYPGLSRALGLRAKAAGIEGFHCHRLRHTFASRWLAAGGSEDGLMAAAGWKDRNMIGKYTSDTQQRRAIEEARRLGLDRF